MLGLRPRLRARNSLWDLVNKQPNDFYLSFQPPWQQQPVEEGADGLPPLPTSPASFPPASPSYKLHTKEFTEEQVPVKMASVSSSFLVFIACSRVANFFLFLYRRKIRSDTVMRPGKTSMARFTLSQAPSLWRRT